MAKGAAKVTGVKHVLRNMVKAKRKQAKGLERGLLLAGLFLQKQSQKVVPVDTGTLRASAFTRKSGSGLSTEVTVGYTTSYAIFVHENLEARHAPGKIAKYLEEPARLHETTLRKIIAKQMEIG